MNASRILAITGMAAFAALASAGAYAGTPSGELGEASPSYITPFHSTADRAAVAATARDGLAVVGEYDEAFAPSQPGTNANRAEVHANAVQAERAGEVARGEG